MTIATALADLAVIVTRRLRQGSGAHGLTGSRRAALRRLVSEGPLQVGALAAGEGVTAATMSRMVDGLVEARLAVRIRAEHDRRGVAVTPTALGRTLLEAVDRAELRWLDSIIEGLDNEDRTAVQRAVEVLLAALDDASGGPMVGGGEQGGVRDRA
jgi:DNA-binding MarR family transcriptional regulator